MSSFETVIGLEVHIQLNTSSKAFARDKNMFINEPNQHISPITLALPGVLPRGNKAHLHKAMKLALTMESKINEYNFFDRKNYFYPDLPKGYQITQDKRPIAVGGLFTFETEGVSKSIRIHHMHMEEDAGKSTHDMDPKHSLIEYNRAGTPLIELVTEPDFRSGQEVHDFLASIQQLVQYLDISDGNMEEGSIRCDCNVSVRPVGQEAYGERCEVKNVNSKRFAREAITYEAQRQIKMIAAGEEIKKTTMLFNPDTGETKPMRKKETENDYRYFPEPDLSPIKLTPTQIEKVKSEIDWLPWTLKAKLMELGLNKEDADKISQEKKIGIQFMALLSATDISGKELGSLFVNKIIPDSAVANIEPASLVTPTQLSSFVLLYTSGQVSKSAALSSMWPEMINKPNVVPLELAKEKNLIIQADQDFLDGYIKEVMDANPDKVKEYKSGKKGLIGFFMGQVKMKAGNNVNPSVLKEKVEEGLK
jgi:aspartyl-tRNA(Asn)/glutamyl-tRNA(Gln) amidotransferase subunit B